MDQDMRRSISILIVCLFIAGSCYTQKNSNAVLNDSLPQGIKVQVMDLNTGASLPARIEIYNEQDSLQSTYYKFLPGVFTDENGSIKRGLGPGKYKVKIFHGIDYESAEQTVVVTQGRFTAVTIQLKPWVNLKKMGWVNGEAHAHLYTELHPDSAMIAGVRKICRAQGVDFICAAQGWAGATDDSWKKDYAFVNDKNFTLYYGAEMPKYRTGHYWWIGLESTKGYFGELLDSAYEKSYYQSPDATHWTFDTLNFDRYSDIEFVPRFSASQRAVAIIAHPTRWWMQERERSVKYTTNAIASLSFSLLSGTPADGLVIMGDFKDHYSYQNLWFQILNLGYCMPAFSELDGGYLPGFKYPFGMMRTFFKTDSTKELITSVVEATKKGRTFVTTGPIILADIDSAFQYGDIIEPDGKNHKLNITAYASNNADDFLSYLLVFRNGKIWKQWDLRGKKERVFNTQITISEKERSWYVIKAYGQKAWKDPSNLEVTGWYDNKRIAESSDRDVCITSPFYFMKKDDVQPRAMISQVELSLTGIHSTSNGILNIIQLGRKIGQSPIKSGKASFKMPINAEVEIEIPGVNKVRRSLATDYKPYLKLIQPLANGDWQKDPEFSATIASGYIPWKVFRYEELKSMLKKVRWEIDMTENDRDRKRSGFEQLFQHP
ncbi:hypothetical protein [Pollutibacter soli]|uniref:hypothetical protein n=1 Tax=Pollutibacter soli TaxID=3034157 RepID=UPI00301329C1